jgi:hypothetical protein
MEGNPAAEWFMTELRHRRPDQWEVEVDAIFYLLEIHGEKAVRQALIKVAHERLIGAEYVAAILDGQMADQESGS